MVRCIRDYYHLTGYKVGFKPAGEIFWQIAQEIKLIFYIFFKGGIRTAKDSCIWLSLMKEELDSEWTTNKLFRIGASALLNDIERQIYHFVTGRYANANELP